MSYKLGRLLLLPLAGCVLSFSALAASESSTEVKAAWRPTLRRSFVFFGSSNKQIELPNLVSGKAPESDAGIVTSYFEPLRFEASASQSVMANTDLFLRVMGGKWKFRLTENQPLQSGTDFNFEVGAMHTSQLSQSVSLNTTVGARVRSWSFAGGEIPKHGNIGILIGVTPRLGVFSVNIEGALAAAWLYDLNTLGAQKDSSVLKIRPQLSLPTGFGTYDFGVEYYHTHTEFFGTSVIPKQNSFMLDDFELSAIAGLSFKL